MLIKKGNMTIFNSYVQTDYFTSIFMTKYDLQMAKSKIHKRIRLIEKILEHLYVNDFRQKIVRM